MRILAAVFAIASGVIVLLGYFVPGDLNNLASLLVEWAVIIAALTALVGFANLVFVHMEKIRMRQKNGIYSAVLILSLISTFGLGLIFRPENPYIKMTVSAVIIPVEASLMAILSVTLVYASIRLLRRRVDTMSVLFLISSLLFLVSFAPTPLGLFPGSQLMLYLLGMLSNGGIRGLLLGIALGTILTGLRVLFGIDRPYGGN